MKTGSKAIKDGYVSAALLKARIAFSSVFCLESQPALESWDIEFKGRMQTPVATFVDQNRLIPS